MFAEIRGNFKKITVLVRRKQPFNQQVLTFTGKHVPAITKLIHSSTKKRIYQRNIELY
jgi:hypothetical protein